MSTSPRTLRTVLLASAAYDLVALGLLLPMPQWIFDLFDHPPVDPYLFRLAALPLWMGAAVYVLAAWRRTRSLVDASLLLRVWGAIGIAGLLLWHRPPGAMAYWSFVVGDLVWAVLLWVTRTGASDDRVDERRR